MRTCAVYELVEKLTAIILRNIEDVSWQCPGDYGIGHRMSVACPCGREITCKECFQEAIRQELSP